MDDAVLTVGGGTTIGAAETATSDQSTDTGSAAPETKTTEDGGERSTAEGGQEQTGGRRKWSMQDEIKELRAQRREWRSGEAERESRYSSLQDELRQLRESIQRQGPGGPAKTPANFWQDPEARLQSLRDEIRDEIGEQNRGLMDAFHQTREQEYAQQRLAQEQASAAEFIRTQKGYDPSDDEDLIEIIGALPKKTRDNSDPQTIAEFAWYKLQAQRGIGDRSLAKQRASGVQGQPPGVGFGRKTWNKAEYDQAVDLVEQKMRANPNDPKMNELFDELMSAHKEGRVR